MEALAFAAWQRFQAAAARGAKRGMAAAKATKAMKAKRSIAKGKRRARAVLLNGSKEKKSRKKRDLMKSKAGKIVSCKIKSHRAGKKA